MEKSKIKVGHYAVLFHPFFAGEMPIKKGLEVLSIGKKVKLKSEGLTGFMLIEPAEIAGCYRSPKQASYLANAAFEKYSEMTKQIKALTAERKDTCLEIMQNGKDGKGI